MKNLHIDSPVFLVAMPGLKVVALISGGKDSFFSILHCLANGHEVVALANLHPPVENGKQSEDIDSFMYQTIGHSVIPLYEQALGLPLYRQEILGTAVDPNKSYATPTYTGTPDETESLIPLLKKVLAAHPEVNAVSTGAILSDYQRTRVESVAIRLGLVPLSYLWQYPFLPPYSETSLLDDMTAVGQDSRIIKVASGGLDDSHLWTSLADPRQRNGLVKAIQRFGTCGDGGAIGEGGEYETLAISGPYPIWKGSIVTAADDRRVVMGDGGIASLHIRNAYVAPHTNQEGTREEALAKLRVPPLLDEKFKRIHSTLAVEAHDMTIRPMNAAAAAASVSAWATRRSGGFVSVSNCIGRGAAARTQMDDIMQRLMRDHQIEPSSIIFTTILLRNMSDFASVNAGYGTHFTSPSPPARVTIACSDTMPIGVDVMLSVLALDSAEEPSPALGEARRFMKRGLHVQSRSYWAPANIGPYSQAISVPTRPARGDDSITSTVFVAGQIPLVPSSMEFPAQESSTPQTHFADQAILSLQHLWRIGQIMDVKLWLGAVAFIGRSSQAPIEDRIQIALQAWKAAHSSSRENEENEEDGDEDEGDDGVDLWDRTHGRHQTYGQSAATSTKRADILGGFVPPCFVAEVETLPRDAPIEWASVGSTAPAQALVKKGPYTPLLVHRISYLLTIPYRRHPIFMYNASPTHQDTNRAHVRNILDSNIRSNRPGPQHQRSRSH